MTPKAILTIRNCDFHTFFARAKCYPLSWFVHPWDCLFLGGCCQAKELMKKLGLVTTRLNEEPIYARVRCKFDGLWLREWN